MKKTTNTVFLDGAVWNLLKNASIPFLVTLLLISSTQLGAQCAMSCFDIQVSLDEDCQATITQDMVSDVPGCYGPFTVQLFDPYGDLIPTSPVVTGAYIGQTLTVGVIDQWSGNNCWSTALIEDKMPPFSLCNDITIGCWELGEYPGPFFFDNCSYPVDIEQIGQEIIVDMGCDPLYVKEILRTWEGTDDWGNSSTCLQTITLERVDTSLLAFPPSRTVNGGNPISCDAPYDLDGDGVIDPSYAGVPTLDGDPLYPLPDIYCNILVSYQDQPFPPLNCVEKVMRVWTFREWWCGDEIIITMPQIIEIVDETPPIITCPEDFSVTTDPQECATTLYLPPATVYDNCNAILNVDVTYPGGFNPNTNGGYATLGVGQNTVVYTAYDACYNPNSCEMTVTVMDETPPIAVCDLHTAVSLTNNGTARVYAETFDDGSHDECYIDHFEVRRMNPGCGYENYFGPYVELSCCDIDFNPIMVVMRVYDHSNNYNDCMVEVQVQDKLPAYIVCPSDITVSCEFPYDMDDLFVFGKVVEADDPNDIGNPLLDPRDSIIFDDPGNPNTSGPTYYGMDGFAYDNCEVTISHQGDEILDQCGEGVILRYFTAEGPGGPSTTCVQTITVDNFDPFYVNESDPYDPYDDIVWPVDITIDAGCEPQDFDPSVTGAPVVDEDACDLVAISEPDDWVFDFNEPGDPACFKILRKWKVINWCEFENGEYTIYSHQQVIKVINTEPPVISAGCDDVSICSYDPECATAFINLTITASDDCTDAEDLDIDYDIDAYNDGTFDFNENYNPYADINNGINQASGSYPVGTHRLVWRVEDRCGNFTTCEILFDIVNCKKATPVCYNGLAAELMPMDTDNDGDPDWAMIELRAEYFDAGTNHPCYDDITLSFSEDINDSTRVFDCTHLGEQYVEMWAHAPNGTSDYCATFVDIQDNNGVCPDVGPVTGNISGVVSTPLDLKVAQVSVELNGNGQTASAGQPAVTNLQGLYNFGNMPYGGSYTVMPEKNDDVLNGVTTLDLALIQRHILGLEIFDEAAEWIAGDIDHNEEIDILDIVELRRVILGVQDEFENNKSWRFVDGNYVFTTDRPLTEEFPEEYHIPVFSQDMMDVDFNGIKVGDINRTADLDGANGAEDRSRDVFALSIPVINVEAGQTVSIPVFSSEPAELMSLQFTIAFDPAVVQIVSVEGKALELSDANTGWSQTDRGMLTFSWNDSKFQSLTDAQELFELTVLSLIEQPTGDMISINGAKTLTEAYTANGIQDVDLRARNSEEIDAVFTVYQNRPNPFSNATSIGFNLPKASSVTLTILDLTGKKIRVLEQDYAKGYHEIEVKASDLSASGVLYYRLDADGYSATKKMIITE